MCAEELTYPGLLSVLAHLHLRPVGVAIDGQGMLPEAFRAACRQHRPKVLYCNPTLHNPTTATLSLERRRALVEIARTHGVAIIEDDAYGALPKHPLAPLAALGPDVVYHVAGLAKCLAPALRIDRRRAEQAGGDVANLADQPVFEIAWEVDLPGGVTSRLEGTMALRPLDPERTELAIAGRFRLPAQPVADTGLSKQLARRTVRAFVRALAEGLERDEPPRRATA